MPRIELGGDVRVPGIIVNAEFDLAPHKVWCCPNVWGVDGAWRDRVKSRRDVAA